MSTRAKVISVLLGVLIVAGAVVAGFYVIVFLYPVWVNERFEVTSNLDGDGMSQQLTIGKVAHGKQFSTPTDPQEVGNPARDFSRLATTYYHRQGPVGRAMERFNWFNGPENTYAADARTVAAQVGLLAMPDGLPMAALVGLWSEPPFAAILIKDGCLASYARSYQWVDFYERNPAFIQLSVPANNEQPRFTFIRDAKERGASVRVLEGPERVVLAERAPKHYYHVLVVDILRGRTDVLAEELMTKEAMAQYFETLVDDGVLLIHTSNRSYNLSPVVADVAQSLGFPCVNLRDSRSSPGPGPRGHFTSEWVLVGRTDAVLARVRAHVPANAAPNGVQIDWQPMNASGHPAWTDRSKSMRGLHR